MPARKCKHYFKRSRSKNIVGNEGVPSLIAPLINELYNIHYQERLYKQKEGQNMTRHWKKTLLAILATAALAFALTGCSGTSTASSSSESASSETPTVQDYGWLSFELPQGWQDAKESDKYETIAETAEPRHIVKFMVNTLNSSFPTAEDKAADDISKEYNHYTEADPIEIDDRTWYVATFEFNGNPSFVAYTDLDEGKCLKVTFYEMESTDPVAQTILSTIKVDLDALAAAEEEADEDSEEGTEESSKDAKNTEDTKAADNENTTENSNENASNEGNENSNSNSNE